MRTRAIRRRHPRTTKPIVGVVLLGVGLAGSSADVDERQTVSRQNSPSLPRFERSLLLEDKAETSANVAIGDVDGDGNPDIVLAKGRHWPLVDRVLLGDGRGNFATAYDLGPIADRSYSGRLVDLDNDRDLDVVISNDAPDAKRIYLNDGKGRFSAGGTYGKAEWPTRNATVADLNSDGLTDIVVANRSAGSGSNYICFNRGNGRFDGDCVAFAKEPATTIAAADFDRDGLMDLAVPHRDGGQSFVYLTQPNAPPTAADKFTMPTFRTVPFGPGDAAIRVSGAADIDGDGLLDIVGIDERRGTDIYFGQAGTRFSAGLRVGGGPLKPYALALGDLNRDGRVDIVVGNIEAPSVVYFNDGSGRRFNTVTFGDSKGTAYGFAIGDLDKDGWPDIAVARSEAQNVVYFASPPRQRSGVRE